MVTRARGTVKNLGGTNTILYKGYVGTVEYDDEAGIFHGEVIGLRDVITFQGESVQELRQALKDSVDEYLDYCVEIGRNPEKPFKGELLLRVDPDTHKKIFIKAKSEGKSINRWISEAVERELV
jgi:predicted HicB family RNase H-like nuclease